MSDDVKVMLVRIDERTQKMQDDVDKLKHVLIEGNGTPAVTVQVATMDQRLKQLEEDQDDRKIPRSVSAGIWVSIVLALIGILAGFSSH